MKRLHTGLLILDRIDILCIGFTIGTGIGYLTKKYRKYKNKNNEDPIIVELKEKSPIITFSKDHKPLKLPMIRGGKLVSLVIKNEKLATLIYLIVSSKRKQKQLRRLRILFAILNACLTSSVGLRFAVGGSIPYTQFILIAFPSTVAGFLLEFALATPLPGLLLPLAILCGRGIETIPNPYERCEFLCKFAQEFHNKQLTLEMKEFNSLVKDASTALNLPLDKVPLLCVEEKHSLLQRYKLRQILSSAKGRKRVQHFNEFIRKFTECDAKPEVVYEQVVEKIAERVKIT